jgi:glucose/arabinose dehydrogenase/cytochrome c551/c552
MKCCQKISTSLKFFSLMVLIALIAGGCRQSRSGKPRILVFGKTADYHHASIPAGMAAIQKLGAENEFDVDTTTDANMFTEDTLKKYSAVIFLSTTGNVLNQYQEVAFERYIQAGGGFVGVHAATDTEYDWGWYGRLVGAYFESHPKIQEAVLHVVDSSIAATKGIPVEWKRTDEWYNFKKLSKDVKVLMTIDEKSYEGGKLGDNHPMSWYHEYDGGRAFYTELGHTEESYADPVYLKHLLGGIQYAVGDNKELNYSKAKSENIPEEDRFVRTNLAQGMFYEPTEMAILPNLDILITQRRGEIMLYSNETKTVKQVGYLNVYSTTTVPNVNAEEGVLGLTADPDFKNNHYVYIYYSPADTSVNRLSRFTFANDTLDLKSEKIILQLYSQRQICCHTGGSLAFGKDNLLYLSTGDNSTPFDEKDQAFVSHGFAPLNDAPGHEQYDARRSSGNTNDLRGKILRIRIKPDGTYEIPEGNLFVNTPKARPEIFVMGDRNPYRISVDKKTGFLYWGEVGPDAALDSFDTRGPRGYDEVNQARKAGFFGWPLFVGNNYPYHEYDYTTGKSGEAFDPAKPINRSRNNTGLQELPPAQPAFIWYPYAASHDFPQVGTGGRNAMAGPVYYVGDYPKETRLPEYFDKKLFVFDWIRGWIRAVTMLPNGDFDKMIPFMENTKFNSPIDMEMGPDGRLYILEYGTGWFSKNPDAGIVRIDYLAGNRPPKLTALTVDKASGGLPFTFNASIEATDPEKDDLNYVWIIGGEKIETKEPKLTHTINKAGDYAISVEVIDDEKAFSKSNVVDVYAGNAQPQVGISIGGNQSFYFPGKPIIYKVNIDDGGDSVNLKNLFVSSDYIRFDRAQQAMMGHQMVSAIIAGQNLMAASDCKTCHKVAEKSIGPSFTDVAQKYSARPDATTYLAEKIIKGGSGVWGETAMAAHPNLKEADATQIVQYVLSLAANKGASKKSLPASGKLMATEPDMETRRTAFAIQATYSDNGGPGIKPLSNTAAAYLRYPNMSAGQLTDNNGFTVKDSAGTRYLTYPQNEGWIKISKVDLTNIKSIEIASAGLNTLQALHVELRANKPDGISVGAVDLSNMKGNINIPLQKGTSGGLEDIYILFKSTGTANPRPLLKSIRFVQ